MDIDTTYCADVFVIPKGDPQIYISKSSINFAAGAGTTTKYDIIEIENHGSPLLIYDASPNKNWITCNPEHANQGQLVDITVSRSNIPQSELNKINHSGTITFSAEDDSGNYGGADLVTITTAIVKPPAFTVSISNAGHYNESPHLVWTSTLAHKYYIYRDPYYAQGYWELIDSTETTSYTDYEVVMTSQAQAEDKFYYKVEARNGAGSTYSNTTSTWGFTMNEANPHEQQLLNSQLPDNYTIDDCYPNPGNPGTTIRFGLPHTGQVSLKIFNIKGELVRSLIDAEQPAGYHEVFWDGKNDQGTAVVTGMYIFVMKAGGEVFHKKFSLIK